MSRATPCFRTAIHLLEKAKAFFQIIPGEEHHASWNQQLVHPDAALIADAPALLARCKELEDQLSVENRHSYGLMQKRNELRVELEKLEAENAELRKRLERKDGLLKEAEAYISTDCSICTLRNSKVCEKSTDCKALELNMNILEEIERKP